MACGETSPGAPRHAPLGLHVRAAARCKLLSKRMCAHAWAGPRAETALPRVIAVPKRGWARSTPPGERDPRRAEQPLPYPARCHLRMSVFTDWRRQLLRKAVPRDWQGGGWAWRFATPGPIAWSPTASSFPDNPPRGASTRPYSSLGGPRCAFRSVVCEFVKRDICTVEEEEADKYSGPGHSLARRPQPSGRAGDWVIASCLVIWTSNRPWPFIRLSIPSGRGDGLPIFQPFDGAVPELPGYDQGGCRQGECKCAFNTRVCASAVAL